MMNVDVCAQAIALMSDKPDALILLGLIKPITGKWRFDLTYLLFISLLSSLEKLYSSDETIFELPVLFVCFYVLLNKFSKNTITMNNAAINSFCQVSPQIWLDWKRFSFGIWLGTTASNQFTRVRGCPWLWYNFKT